MNKAYPIDGSRDALWMATAVDAPTTAPLTEAITCDVAIIGGGFTGLNAALHLALHGTSVCVLESAKLGFGASGRSGGQVNLGLNIGPDALLKKFGTAQGERLISTIINTPNAVFKLIRTHQLRCDPVQNGWLQAAANDTQLKQQQRLVDEYARHGFQFERLDQSALHAKSGAEHYRGGLFCAVAGSLQPLSYTRELARAALQHGAQIYTDSPVTGLTQTANGWQIQTHKAQLNCQKVLICTNGYTDKRVGQLQRAVVPVRSILMASEPLSAALRRRILPNQVTFVDKRRLILYFRYDRDGRLCVGDHGPMRDAFSLQDYRGLKKRAARVFPDLAGFNWDFHWGGRVAMTRDTLPFLCEAQPGLIAGMGYNGRGVGMGSVMGRIMAEYILGMPAAERAFPLTTPKYFPLHRLHAVGVTAAVKWYALLDFLECHRLPNQ